MKEIYQPETIDDLTKFKVQIKGSHASDFAVNFKKYFNLPLHEYDTMFGASDKIKWVEQ